MNSFYFIPLLLYANIAFIAVLHFIYPGLFKANALIFALLICQIISVIYMAVKLYKTKNL